MVHVNRRLYSVMNKHKTNVPVTAIDITEMERKRGGGKTGGGEGGVGGREGGREDRLSQGVLSQKHSFYLLRITVLRRQSSLLYFILCSPMYSSAIFPAYF